MRQPILTQDSIPDVASLPAEIRRMISDVATAKAMPPLSQKRVLSEKLVAQVRAEFGLEPVGSDDPCPRCDHIGYSQTTEAGIGELKQFGRTARCSKCWLKTWRKEPDAE